MPFLCTLRDAVSGEEAQLLDEEGGRERQGARGLSVALSEETARDGRWRRPSVVGAIAASVLVALGLAAGSSLLAARRPWRPATEAEVQRPSGLWWDQQYKPEVSDIAEPPKAVSPAQLQEFYMYRATKRGVLSAFSFGNINTGNMDGVMWYLMNEVVTLYASGPRCPRKFNISEIHRFKIRTRAPAALIQEGMNFGPRFAFDEGMCRGRCFVNNSCSCEPDCDFHYKKYGYMVGCNNFKDKYPFPDGDTAAINGIWYALPLKGRCAYPTGAPDCTWSYEHAGVITLHDLESTSPGGPDDNCCDGKCSTFWDGLYDVGKTFWRVNQALDIFHSKYPDLPRDLAPAMCDFNWWKWYNPDLWAKMDPWRRDRIMEHGRPDPLKQVDPMLNASLRAAWGGPALPPASWSP